MTSEEAIKAIEEIPGISDIEKEMAIGLIKNLGYDPEITLEHAKQAVRKRLAEEGQQDSQPPPPANP